MQSKEILYELYQTRYERGKELIEKNDPLAAKAAFKGALRAAIELAEQSEGAEREKYIASATAAAVALEKLGVRPANAATSAAARLKLDVWQGEDVSKEKVLAKLNALVGLKSVKEQVKNVMTVFETAAMRKARGLPLVPPSPHMIFIGNAGTGKTAVARIVAQMYKALGVLSKGHVVEVSRGELVSGYVGQTAAKTRAVIDEAMGGVLLINAPELLVRYESPDFGHESIAELLSAMRERREDLVVIFNGYDSEINKLSSMYPDVRLLIKTEMRFPDYTGEELYDIFVKMCERDGYKFESDAVDILRKHFDVVFENRTRSTGNARYVRNIFENSIERQSRRLASRGDLDLISFDELTTVLAVDLPPEYINT